MDDRTPTISTGHLQSQTATDMYAQRRKRCSVPPRSRSPAATQPANLTPNPAPEGFNRSRHQRKEDSNVIVSDRLIPTGSRTGRPRSSTNGRNRHGSATAPHHQAGPPDKPTEPPPQRGSTPHPQKVTAHPPCTQRRATTDQPQPARPQGGGPQESPTHKPATQRPTTTYRTNGDPVSCHLLAPSPSRSRSYSTYPSPLHPPVNDEVIVSVPHTQAPDRLVLTRPAMLHDPVA
jgi:hypothetical protein